MKSTIYVKCPQCRESGLLVDRQGRYFCANCMYDYTDLKEDKDKLEEILIENLKEKGFGPLFAMALYERVTLSTSETANDYIMKLAKENNIQIIPGKREIVKSFASLFIILGIVIAIVITVIIVISVYG